MSLESLKSFVAERFVEAKVESHPLFVRMRDDALSASERETLGTQLFHVVDFFPRFLAALIANIDDLEARLPLVENLFEEHGRMRVAHAHVTTFRDFLHALGVDDAAIAASRPSVGVIAYQRGLLDLCARGPLGMAFGAMGAVEEIVARVSPIVGAYGARRTSGPLGTHFGVHEKLDLSHADELYTLAAGRIAKDGLESIHRGIELGIYFQRRLYDDLVGTTR